MLLGFAVLALAFVLPGHYPPWTSFEQEAASFVGAALLGFDVIGRRGTGVFPTPQAVPGLLLVSTVPLWQWLFGQLSYKTDVFVTSLFLLAFAACFMAGSVLIATRRCDFTAGLAAVFIGTGIVSCGLATVQWLDLASNVFVVSLIPGGRPYGNVAQPNNLASLLALGIMAALQMYEGRRVCGPVASLTVAWFGLGLVMTQSRSGWLFVVLLVVFSLCIRRRATLRIPSRALLLGAGTFFLAVSLWPLVNEVLLLAPGDLGQRLRSGNGWLRWIHWQTLWDAIWRAPWLGYGWGQVTLAQQAAVLDHPATGEWLMNSHNLLLDLLIWNGVPLGALLFGALVFWFARQMHVCRSSDQWALLGSVGAVFLHAMLEFPLNYAYFLLPVGLMMGGLDGLDEVARKWLIPRWAFVVPWAVTVAMMAWVGVEYLHVQDVTWQQRFVMMGIDTDRHRAVPPPDVVLLDVQREFHRFWTMQATRGMSTEQIDWMRRVSQRNAMPPAMLRFALAAGLNGRPLEAGDTLRKLCKMHPIERCEEGAQAWKALGQQYPELRPIEFPPVPPELIALRVPR